MSLGVSFPIVPATGSLWYLEPTQTVVAAIESNVRALLLTNWGERVMHYSLGCNMREFLFEPMTPALRDPIAARIKGQLAKWMPFLTLDELFVDLLDGSGALENGVTVKLRLLYGNIPIDVLQTITP